MLVPPGETIVETKSCQSCGISFAVTDRDIEFYDKVSPVFAGHRENIPAPTLCPDCRQRRRLAWRNERKLYKRKCDLTGKDIVSIYSPDKPHKVYHQDAWWSDGWDALDYGRGYDFSRTFAEQYAELQREMPAFALLQVGCEDSQYTQDAYETRGSYLVSTAWQARDCLYGGNVFGSNDCVDAFWALGCHDCYEVVKCTRCHSCRHALDCVDCARSEHIVECADVRDSLYCFGLRNASHHFLNQSYSPEEVENIRVRLASDSDFATRTWHEFARLVAESPRRHLVLDRCERAVGNMIENGRDLYACFDVHECEDCRYSYNIGAISDAHDVTITGSLAATRNSLLYEDISAPNSDRTSFCVLCQDSADLLYCRDCFSCHDCFACVGLRHKQYCILNKQYTEAEYNELVPKIIEHMRKMGEWGEFFSPSLSPFGYNETVAMEYYPLTKEEALKQGFNWSEYEAPFPAVSKIIPAAKLPEKIADIPDDILNWAIECEVTRKPYRIIKQELEFYRKHSLPIPRRHPDQRHLDRLALRNPRKLHERTCDNCSKEIVTTYAPDRPERVYCEGCYRREMYG